MTDAEIIGNLELHNGYGLIDQTLKLINRQNEQIEGLQDEVVIKTDMLNRQKAEIDTLQTLVKITKTEAIHEFWNRLKTEKFKHKNFGEFVYVEDGDNLVKEMVGENSV